MSNILNKLKERVARATDNHLASEEVRISRLKICIECEHLIKITRQCSKCFCVIDGKTMLKKSQCPVGKWSNVIIWRE